MEERLKEISLEIRFRLDNGQSISDLLEEKKKILEGKYKWD